MYIYVMLYTRVAGYMLYVMLCYALTALSACVRAHTCDEASTPPPARARVTARPLPPPRTVPRKKPNHPRKRRGAANLRVLSTALLVAGAAVVVVDPGVARGQRQRRLIGLVHTRRRSKHSRLRRNPDVWLHYALPTWRWLA